MDPHSRVRCVEHQRQRVDVDAMITILILAKIKLLRTPSASNIILTFFRPSLDPQQNLLASGDGALRRFSSSFSGHFLMADTVRQGNLGLCLVGLFLRIQDRQCLFSQFGSCLIR